MTKTQRKPGSVEDINMMDKQQYREYMAKGYVTPKTSSAPPVYSEPSKPVIHVPKAQKAETKTPEPVKVELKHSEPPKPTPIQTPEKVEIKTLEKPAIIAAEPESSFAISDYLPSLKTTIISTLVPLAAYGLSIAIRICMGHAKAVQSVVPASQPDTYVLARAAGIEQAVKMGGETNQETRAKAAIIQETHKNLLENIDLAVIQKKFKAVASIATDVVKTDIKFISNTKPIQLVLDNKLIAATTAGVVIIGGIIYHFKDEIYNFITHNNEEEITIAGDATPLIHHNGE